MEKKKTEFRALIDKVSKERKRDGCLPIKTVNGKEKVDYYIFLKEILSKRTNSTFPASTDECLSALLLSSSILYEKTSVFSYKKSFKYACDINHPSLNNLINELDISELELQEIFDIAQQHNGELLEYFHLFKNEKNETDIEAFSHSRTISLIDEIAENSKHGTIVSHPVKMSNPACKFPKILFKGNNAINQGYIKSGDLGGHFDLHINANKLKVFKFLSLKINGESIWQIIGQKNIQSICDRFLVDEKKARGWVEKFSSCLNSQDDRTNTFVRQVYFPTENSYHQLSILQPSGLIFSLKEKIDDINSRSCNAFLGRKAKKDNKFYRPGFSSVPNLTITKHGGDHPKNISALNNKYQTYFLLGSSPPHLEKRDIHFPTRNFFVESIRYYDVREPLNKLHHIFQADSNSDIPRRNLESGRDQHILAVFDAVIERMAVLRQVAEEQFREDSSLLDHYQKVWLCPGFETERAEANDWLDQLCKKITDWLLDAYKKTVKKALVLGAAEVSHIQQLIESHREVLR